MCKNDECIFDGSQSIESAFLIRREKKKNLQKS